MHSAPLTKPRPRELHPYQRRAAPVVLKLAPATTSLYFSEVDRTLGSAVLSVLVYLCKAAAAGGGHINDYEALRTRMRITGVKRQYRGCQGKPLELLSDRQVERAIGVVNALSILVRVPGRWGRGVRATYEYSLVTESGIFSFPDDVWAKIATKPLKGGPRRGPAAVQGPFTREHPAYKPTRGPWPTTWDKSRAWAYRWTRAEAPSKNLNGGASIRSDPDLNLSLRKERDEQPRSAVAHSISEPSSGEQIALLEEATSMPLKDPPPEPEGLSLAAAIEDDPLAAFGSEDLDAEGNEGADLLAAWVSTARAELVTAPAKEASTKRWKEKPPRPLPPKPADPTPAQLKMLASWPIVRSLELWQPPISGIPGPLGTWAFPPDPYRAVRPVFFPKAPRLPKDADDEELVRLLLRAYRVAVEARLKKKAFAFSKGVARDHELWAPLVAMAQALRDRKIAPLVWAAFSCDVWVGYVGKDAGGGKRNPPPLKWVWSSSRLVEHEGWFLECADNYCNERLRTNTMQVALLDAYKSVVARIRRVSRARPPTQEEVLALAAAFDWELLIHDALRERKRLEEDGRRAVIQRGAWVW